MLSSSDEKLKQNLSPHWREKYLAPEMIFLALALIFGMIFVFVTPPFQAPDEVTHFYRAYQISNANLFSERKDNLVGGWVPKSFPESVVHFNTLPHHPENKISLDTILKPLKQPLNKENIVFASFPNTALYPPIPYIPQSLGLLLGGVLNQSPVILMYLGRVFNLWGWVFLIFYAVRFTPIMKWAFISLALMPMSLFMAASLSADAFTNGVAFLTIAMILGIAFESKKDTNQKKIFLLTLLVLALSLVKPIYVLITFLFLIVPFHHIGSKKKYFFTFSLIFGLGILVQSLWIIFTKDIYVPSRSGAMPHEQFHFVVHYPLTFLRTLFNSFYERGINYITSFIGTLGWLDTLLPKKLILLVGILLIFCSLIDTSSGIKLEIKQKITSLLTFLLILMAVFFSQYLVWTDIGKGEIDGIQGRYFIPISPLLFLVFYNPKIKIFRQNNLPLLIFPTFLILVLIWSSLVLYGRYYA